MKIPLAYLENNYHVNKPLNIVEEVSTGFLSQNFIVGDKNHKYFLKQYRFKTEDNVKTTHKVKYFFSEGGVPILLPIRDINKQSYFQFGQNFYALFPFINGIQLSGNKMEDKSIQSLATTLAKIHHAGASPNKPDTSIGFKGWNKNETIIRINQLLEIINHKKEKSNFDELAKETLEYKLKLVKKNEILLNQLNLSADHLVHGDYHDKNIFFDQQGEIAYVFDLEKSELQPRVAELFRSMDYIFLNGNYKSDNIKRAQLYLKYYHQNYPLTSQEVLDGFTYYYLKMVHGLWIETEHYINNNSRPDILLKHQLPSLIYFSQNFDQFSQLLVNQLKS